MSNIRDKASKFEELIKIKIIKKLFNTMKFWNENDIAHVSSQTHSSS